MKLINTTLKLIGTILVFALLPGMALGQTLPVCNEKSALAWDMNTESDMKEYVLYHGPESGITKGGANVATVVIPHDPSTATDNGDGTFTVVHSLALPEGDTFMAVSAKDTSENETGLSNEVGCKINMTPRTPTIELRFTSAG